MIALIPARGGSQGLPKKNILPLNGKPLIAHTIEAVLGSRIFSQVIVSTDSGEIADISKAAGAEVPFLRPSALAQNESLARDVYLHALGEVEKKSGPQKSFGVFLPTSPLRSATDIVEAHQLFLSKEADSVISMTKMEKPINWIKNVGADLKITTPSFSQPGAAKNRQDETSCYIPNGAIYFFRSDFFRSSESYYGEQSFAYCMPPERSVDVDSQLDFDWATFLMKRNHGH